MAVQLPRLRSTGAFGTGPSLFCGHRYDDERKHLCSDRRADNLVRVHQSHARRTTCGEFQRIPRNLRLIPHDLLKSPRECFALGVIVYGIHLENSNRHRPLFELLVSAECDAVWVNNANNWRIPESKEVQVPRLRVTTTTPRTDTGSIRRDSRKVRSENSENSEQDEGELCHGNPTEKLVDQPVITKQLL